MYRFQPTKTFQSKKFEGVSFTIRVMTDGVKTRLRLAMADALEELRTTQAEMESIDFARDSKGEIDDDVKVDPTKGAKFLILSDRIETTRRLRVNPLYYRESFVNVEGLEIEGHPGEITSEVLREFGPSDLYDEIIDAITTEIDLAAKEAENLGSPITSAAPVDGRTNDSIAGIVENTNCISNGTAESTSLKM